MRDLPRTSFAHAQHALAAAHDAGLRNVRIGSRHQPDAELRPSQARRIPIEVSGDRERFGDLVALEGRQRGRAP